LQQQAAQEMQKHKGGGGVPETGNLENMDMDELRSMFADALQDPETQQYLEQMGQQFGAAIEQLSQMSPEQLEQQMQEAMKLLTQGDMVETVIQQREEIIKSLEASGGVPPEELARYKSDPAYFELKMRESFDQMKGLLTDPEYVKTMSEAMGGMKELLSAEGGLFNELEALMGSGDLTDDSKIEKARLELLSGKFDDNKLLKDMIDTDEMQALLNNPKKWRDSVKEGSRNLVGRAAGVGEL
jgi:hypothetical protein